MYTVHCWHSKQLNHYLQYPPQIVCFELQPKHQNKLKANSISYRMADSIFSPLL
jgi:hypothetical protein